MASSVQNYAQTLVNTPPRTDQSARKTDKNQDSSNTNALTAASDSGDENQTKQLQQTATANTGASSQQASRGRGSVIDITV